MRLRSSHSSEHGTTLPEVMMSALLVAVFFASIFEVNAVAFRYINASKETVAAIQGVQDRLETLRNLAFTELTDADYVRTTIMPKPSNVSDFANRVIEEVTITAYDIDSAGGGTVGSGIKIRRPAGANVTPVFVGTPDPNIASARAVLVNVRYEWQMALTSGRQRVEETSSIVSAGLKK
jgi:hypothetical protein